MPPSPAASAASCISRPRSAIRRTPSATERLSAATRAAISPSECPPIASGSTSSEIALQPAIAAQKIAGCA